MKLSIQVQAFLNLMKKFLIAMVICGAIGVVASLVPVNTLLGCAGIALMFFAGYNLYRIELSELERKQDAKFDQK
jgi:hypothetical protein